MHQELSDKSTDKPVSGLLAFIRVAQDGLVETLAMNQNAKFSYVVALVCCILILSLSLSLSLKEISCEVRELHKKVLIWLIIAPLHPQLAPIFIFILGIKHTW